MPTSTVSRRFSRRTIERRRGGALLLALAGAVHADILTTPGHVITITRGCAEGEVTCSDVSARIERRTDGRSIELDGEALHTPCADGQTPCRFLGYRFAGGGYTYDMDEAGRLRILDDAQNAVSEEQGTWTWEDE